MAQGVLMGERRRRAHDSLQGLRRIDHETLETLREEDKKWQGKDPELYLSSYSLENHHLALADLLVNMGEVGGMRDPREEALRSSAAANHDVGKREARCQLYRLNRKLTRRELRQVRKHPRYSAQHVRKNRDRVRAEDTELRELLKYVEVCVLWHDRPWRVRSKWLRVITWDLRFADSYMAQRENRETPSTSPAQAMENGIQWIMRSTPWYVRLFYQEEIQESIRRLRAAVTTQLR